MYWENLWLGEPEDGGFSDVLLRAKLLASAGLRAPPLLQALWRAGLCQALLRPGAWLPEGCSLLRGTGKEKMCREI